MEMEHYAFFTSTLIVSGQLHAPSCFTPVKVPLYPCEQELVVIYSRTGLLTLQIIETRFTCRPARGLVTVLTELTRFAFVICIIFVWDIRFCIMGGLQKHVLSYKEAVLRQLRRKRNQYLSRTILFYTIKYTAGIPTLEKHQSIY